MSSSEALQEIRQTVEQGGEDHPVIHGEYTLGHSIDIPKLRIPGIGMCRDITLRHSIAATDQYTNFGADMSYAFSSFYLSGTVKHAAFLRIHTSDHGALDSHMQDREYRFHQESLNDGEPVPFPSYLSRATIMPNASDHANRLPSLHIGREQLYMAGLILRTIVEEYPPAGLFSVGDHDSIPRDWLENYADWLDGK